MNLAGPVGLIVNKIQPAHGLSQQMYINGNDTRDRWTTTLFRKYNYEFLLVIVFFRAPSITQTHLPTSCLQTQYAVITTALSTSQGRLSCWITHHWPVERKESGAGRWQHHVIGRIKPLRNHLRTLRYRTGPDIKLLTNSDHSKTIHYETNRPSPNSAWKPMEWTKMAKSGNVGKKQAGKQKRSSDEKYWMSEMVRSNRAEAASKESEMTLN